jgi:hypothetical protein
MFVSRWDAAGADGSSSTQDGQGPPEARPAWKSGGFWHARHNRTGMPVFCSLGWGRACSGTLRYWQIEDRLITWVR